MQILFSVLAIILIWCIVIIQHDTRNFVVRRYEVTHKKIREEATIVLISDLHEQDYGAHNERVLKAVEEAHPDLILSAGDLITCHHHKEHLSDEVALRLVGDLTKLAPVVCANGNHETRLSEATDVFGDYYASYEKKLAETGATVLRNASTRDLLENTDIHGLEIDSSWYRRFPKETLGVRDLTDRLGTPDEERFHILIAHDPRHFKAYAQWGADLTVSGHVHGGIARLPGLGGVIAPSFELFPHYDAGEFSLEGDGRCATMIISCGLGSHTIKVRFANPGEIAVIRLHPAQ